MTIHFRVANRDTHARYPFAAKAAPLQLGQTLQHDHLLVALHVAAGKPCANASEWTQAITKPCKALTRAAQNATSVYRGQPAPQCGVLIVARDWARVRGPALAKSCARVMATAKEGVMNATLAPSRPASQSATEQPARTAPPARVRAILTALAIFVAFGGIGLGIALITGATVAFNVLVFTM